MATADEHQPSPDDAARAASSGVSRRGVLSGALWAGVGGLAVGAAGGGSAGWAQASSTHNDNNDKDTVDLHRSYPFYGQAHPAGVATDPQRDCVFMSFTLAPARVARICRHCWPAGRRPRRCYSRETRWALCSPPARSRQRSTPVRRSD